MARPRRRAYGRERLCRSGWKAFAPGISADRNPGVRLHRDCVLEVFVRNRNRRETDHPIGARDGDVRLSPRKVDQCGVASGFRQLVRDVRLIGDDMNQSAEVLQGTLDLLILKTVALQPMHGWGIAQRIQQISREVLQIQQGSLYPALYRLERKGLVRAEWGASENNRRAKYYTLTKAGRNKWEKELAQWERLSSAVALILQRA